MTQSFKVEDLADEAAVLGAAEAILGQSSSGVEGILVQPQLKGRRELVAGLFRDEQFGPVIMFGLGGIFTEALADMTLRLAPLGEEDAQAMLCEIRAQALLGAFRGEAPAERETLVRTLRALSRIATEHPEIAEIDINPLIVSPDGTVCAVDALVITAPAGGPATFPPPVDPEDIYALYHPRSIAFIGASPRIGKWGHMLLTHTISGGYEGEIYLVNAKGEPIAGRQVYRSVTEVPGRVDLGIVTVPASSVMDLIPQFQQKGIRNMLLITSGFAETGAKGQALERELVEKARAAGILVLGPNTMGICNPHIRFFCTGSPVAPAPGSTAVVAQSGNMGVQLLAFAEAQGIGIRGFCGSGNEAMVTVEDFLEGFARDETTRIVMLYVESVKNGPRFFTSARRLGRKKPIVLLKGGQSEVGGRAAASHTGALSSNAKVFDALCKQAGIVKVEHPMDLLDLAAAFSSLPLPRGNRVGIMTLGGGWGVITADLCARYGLAVPELPPPIVARLDEILPPYWSRANPIDIVGEPDNTLMTRSLEELMQWDGCDAVINLGVLGRRIFLGRMADAVERSDPTYSPELLKNVRRYLVDFEEEYIRLIAELMERYNKPVYGVCLLTDETNRMVYPVADCSWKSVFYPSPERAVNACAKMYEYGRFLGRT